MAIGNTDLFDQSDQFRATQLLDRGSTDGFVKVRPVPAIYCRELFTRLLHISVGAELCHAHSTAASPRPFPEIAANLAPVLIPL